MGTESEIWGNSGAKHQITFKGKVFEPRLIDGVVKTEFEKRLFERAKIAAKSNKAELGQEWYVSKLNAINEEYLLGEYDLFSKRGLDYMKSIQGGIFLFSLLVGCPESDVVSLALAQGTELQSLLSLIIKESFPGVDFDKVTEEVQKIESPNERFIQDVFHKPISTQELLETQGPK